MSCERILLRQRERQHRKYVSSSQLSFASMPPTAAMGLASTSDVPNTAAASIDVELVIIPQPKSTWAVPPIDPGRRRVLQADDAIIAARNDVAVAVAVIVGAAVMNIELVSCCWDCRLTRTALVSLGIGAPADGASWRWCDRDRGNVIVAREIGLLTGAAVAAAPWHRRPRSPRIGCPLRFALPQGGSAWCRASQRAHEHGKRGAKDECVAALVVPGFANSLHWFSYRSSA